jgi:hypothetical protein
MSVDELIIEIEDDVATPETKSEVSLSDNPMDGIEDLRRQLNAQTEETARLKAEAENSRIMAAEAERRRAHAEQVASESQRRAHTSNVEAETQQLNAIVNAKHAITAELNSLRAEYVKAQTDGEFEVAGDLNLKISKASARLNELERGESILSEKKKNPAPEPQPQPQIQETQDQFNSRPWNQTEINFILSTQTPSTADWMRANPRYFTDVAFRQQVVGAHTFVTGKGIQADTPEYFKRINDMMGIGQPQSEPQGGQPVSEAARSQSRQSVPPAAPSRTIPSSSGDQPGKRTVSLTRAQVEFARANFKQEKPTDPAPEVQYARHLEDIRKEGRLKGDGTSI